MLSEVEKDEIEARLERYEERRAASIDALKIVQRRRGWAFFHALDKHGKAEG